MGSETVKSEPCRSLKKLYCETGEAISCGKEGIKAASVKGTSPERCNLNVSIEGEVEGEVSGVSDTLSWLDILVGENVFC